MQPVNFFSDIEHTFGALGYSILQKTYSGEVQRMTLLFLRDSNGMTTATVMLPSENLAGGIY